MRYISAVWTLYLTLFSSWAFSREAVVSLPEKQSGVNDVLSVNSRRLKLLATDLRARSNFPNRDITLDVTVKHKDITLVHRKKRENLGD